MKNLFRVLVACVALIALALVVRVLRLDPKRSESVVDAPTSTSGIRHDAVALEAVDASANPDVARSSAVSARVQASETAFTASATRAARTQSVSGRVCFADGRIAASVDVVARVSTWTEKGDALVDELRTTTDAAGEFCFEIDDRGGTVIVEDVRYFTLCKPTMRTRTANQRVHVVIAPVIAIAGTVTDDAGTSVSGASVGLSVPGEAFAACAACLEGEACSFHDSVDTDSLGRFAFVRAPSKRGARLHVTAPGFEPRELEAPTVDEHDLEIQLVRNSVLRGRVVHVDGRPALAARVHGGAGPMPVNESGEFQLDVRSSSRWPKRITAVEPGFCPVTITVESLANDVTIVLEHESNSISGFVEDADGKPLAGWNVSVVSKRRVFDDKTYVTAEELAGASTSRPTTDAQGLFELTGLCDDVCDLRAKSADSSAVVNVERVPVGMRDMRIRVSKEATLESLTGLVRTRDGRAVQGVSVRVSRIEPAPRNYTITGGHSARTDADGRFVLRRVPREHLFVELRGDSIIPIRQLSLHYDESKELVIEVAERAAFRVEPSAVSGANAVGANARSGEALDLYQMQANGYFGPLKRMKLGADGDTSWMHVDADAAELVFYRGDEIVARRDVRLSAKEPTVIR